MDGNRSRTAPSPEGGGNPQLVVMLGEILAKRRLETEGVLGSLPKSAIIQKQKQYAEGFLDKLRQFFEL
jgi:hypothetical protein